MTEKIGSFELQDSEDEYEEWAAIYELGEIEMTVGVFVTITSDCWSVSRDIFGLGRDTFHMMKSENVPYTVGLVKAYNYMNSFELNMSCATE